MFDMTNEEAIIQMVDGRHEDCFVIPLYIHINQVKYSLWEIDSIETFSPNTIKVGFGSSMGLMVDSPFPTSCMYEFDITKTFHHYDYDRNVDVHYYVFESGWLTDDELKDDFHKQIQKYVEAISAYIEKRVEERRQQVRRQMMEDEDNYIDQYST